MIDKIKKLADVYAHRYSIEGDIATPSRVELHAAIDEIADKDTAIDLLRCQLQNCVSRLERMRIKRQWFDLDEVIEPANVAITGTAQFAVPRVLHC